MPRTGSIASKVGPAVEQHALACEELRLPGGMDRREDLVGLEHPTVARLAAGLVAGAGAKNCDAIRDKSRDVALVRRIRPHQAIHCRRDEQGTLAGQRERGQQIVGVAVGSFRQEVRRRRRDDNAFRAARQIDVAHSIVRAGGPMVGVDGASGERLQCQRRNEAAGCVGHADIDGDPVLHEQASELRRPCTRRCRQ
jgi:hypothetical protein